MYRKIIIPLVLTFVIALTACNMNEATVSPDAFYTQVAETAEVAEALTAMAVSATPSNTPTLTITNTLEFSLTPTTDGSTKTPWSSSTPRPPGTGTACDNALFMNVQDPPDFSTIAPETEFEVTWRFKTWVHARGQRLTRLYSPMYPIPGRVEFSIHQCQRISPSRYYLARKSIFPSPCKLQQKRMDTRFFSNCKMPRVSTFCLSSG